MQAYPPLLFWTYLVGTFDAQILTCAECNLGVEAQFLKYGQSFEHSPDIFAWEDEVPTFTYEYLRQCY